MSVGAARAAKSVGAARAARDESFAALKISESEPSESGPGVESEAPSAVLSATAGPHL